MQPQVILAASRTEGNIVAWDLETGTALTQYKANVSSCNCVCRLGNDYLVSAQLNKDALHFWTWHKDSVLQRSFMMERGTAVAATRDGMYLAVGSATGNIGIWEVASGQLLTTWPAHYKAVSALAFLDGGHVLVSGGEDTLVCSWLLSDALDSSRDPNSPASRLQPLHSWSEHTLPVTALSCSAGEATAVVATVALDRTLKLWSVATGGLLRSVQLPAALLSVELDAGGQAAYAGGADGVVYEVSLALDAPVDLMKGMLGSREQRYARLEGHSGGVGSLTLSVDGELLASGSDDGTVRLWDVRSRQTMRQLQLPGKVPVSTVLVLPRPEYLQPAGQGGGEGASTGEGRKGPKCPRPLAALAKFPGTASSLQPWEGPPVVLDGSTPFQGIAAASRLAAVAAGGGPALLAAHTAAHVEGEGVLHAGADAMEGVELAASKVEALEGEVAGLQQQLAAAQQAARQWQQMHAELHGACVQKILKGALGT